MGCKGGGENTSSSISVVSESSDELPFTSSSSSSASSLSSKPLSNFHFPIKKHVHLLPHWERFVNRGVEWKAKASTVVCEKHFTSDVLNQSSKRTHLNWKKDPVPTVYVNEMLVKYPSMTPTPVIVRKPPRKRLFQDDELPRYASIDPVLHNLKELENHCPKGFTARMTDEYLLFYRIVFDEETQFPKVLESIRVDEHFHVQLQYNGDPVPLPPWFVDHSHGNAKLTRASMLSNIIAHMQNIASETPYSLIDELSPVIEKRSIFELLRTGLRNGKSLLRLL